MSTDVPLLRAENIVKKFGGTTALDNVRLSLHRGRVHALMGENGAGKSTLGKIISGVYSADGGEIYFEERPVRIGNTTDAASLGIHVVLQEFNLVGDLSVAENLFLNDPEYYGHGIVRSAKMFGDSLSLLAKFGMESAVDPRQKVNTLSIAEMQVIEILKAVKHKSRVLILDEPTAALTQVEAGRLFSIINDLKAQDVAILIVSHRIEEIFKIADTVTVLRDGKPVMDGVPLSSLDENRLVSAMVGREIVDLYGGRGKPPDGASPVVLEVKNLSDRKGRVRGVSFSLRKGEILGVTGLVGAGRSELIRCVFGADRSEGEIYIKGEPVRRAGIRTSISKGVSMVPEDRKHDGLLLQMSILRNITMVKVGYEKAFIMNQREERRIAGALIEKLRIKLAGVNLPVSSLSGGNQQKVMLAKWLTMSPDILIVDEPTRGIDISAKSEIYAILNALAESGVSVLMVSSEMPEVIGMCDRIIVMRDGKAVKELSKQDATEEAIAHSSMLPGS